MTPRSIRFYIKYLQDQGLFQSTVATYTRSLFSFTNWLATEGYSETYLKGNVKRPKIPASTREPFSDLEVKKLIVACSSSVPFSPKTALALRAYLNRERQNQDSTTFFVSRTGQPFSVNALLQMVKRAGKRAGVENVHPHRFRHTFAVSYIRNGGDGFTLKRLLGHKTPDLTNRYLNIGSADLTTRHRAESPVTHIMRRVR